MDLQKYAGTWYEIARYPNRFQRDCAGDVTAEYSIRPDGKVTVVTACRKPDGEMKSARGTARVVDRESNARLKVTFFWPFSGDYWIVNLVDGQLETYREPWSGGYGLRRVLERGEPGTPALLPGVALDWAELLG